ncbi:MAG TPA: hypothetical protein VHK69_16255 [Chitinophagaceae bacterium]|jgi:hypothetical protein|nr:hypothetical protein [Chitinophagaceae bacterium]
MKHLFLLLTLACSLAASAQHISGIYAGSLVNDSARTTHHYEIGLSEYKGVITGYAYTTFVANDTFYYSIRKVRAEKRRHELVIEDEKILAHNFPQRPDKGVGRTITIPLPEGLDTLRSAKGSWKTNQTRKFYATGGEMKLGKTTDSSRSPLIAHLTELGILRQTALQEPANTAAVPDRNNKKTETPGAIAPQPKPAAAAEKSVPSTATAPASLPPLTSRANTLTQTVEVSSDSLTLSFYDNGVVDGDTISVFLNGQNIIERSKLMAAATRRTIALPATAGETFTLTLVAENLGTIPPNTGLLIIQDGAQRWEVRFSADMRTNATVLLKRRRKQ